MGAGGVAPVKIHHIGIAELEADLAADPSAGAVTSAVVWLRVFVTGARIDVDAYRIDVDGGAPADRDDAALARATAGGG